MLNATSDHDALNVAITNISTNNMLDLRTEIVQEMESDLGRNLLEPSAEQPTCTGHRGVHVAPGAWNDFPVLRNVSCCFSCWSSKCLFGLLFMFVRMLWPLGAASVVPHRGAHKLRGLSF